MVCCIAADLITNPTLTLKVSVVCLFRQLIFLVCIFSWCAFCTDGIYPDVYYS